MASRDEEELDLESLMLSLEDLPQNIYSNFEKEYRGSVDNQDASAEEAVASDRGFMGVQEGCLTSAYTSNNTRPSFASVPVCSRPSPAISRPSTEILTCSTPGGSDSSPDSSPETVDPACVIPRGTTTRVFHCKSCHFVFGSRSSLMKHIRQKHAHRWKVPVFQWGGEQQPPWIMQDGGIDERLKEIYSRYGVREIERSHRYGTISSQFNFHLPSGKVTSEDIDSQLDEIFSIQEKTFKINLSLGMILKNIETEEYRYWWAHYNDPVMKEPEHISKKEDILSLKKKLEKVDFEEQAWRQRPSTKFTLLRITNVRWYVTESEFVLGNPENIPDYILKKRSLLSFSKFNDNLCSFRCLAFHNTGNKRGLEKLTYKYFKKWRKFRKETIGVETFSGVSLHDMSDFEALFKVAIDIYSIDENENVQIVYKSNQKFKKQMKLNLCGNHLSYILQFESYAKKFECRNCGKIFKRVDAVKIHEKSCDKATKMIFPGGFLKQGRSMFDELRGIGIDIPKEDCFFPFFVVYDFEVYFNQDVAPSTANTQYTAEHIPISVALCSNIPGFEIPKCFVTENSEELVGNMIDYLEQAREKASALIHLKFKKAFDYLESRLEEINDLLPKKESSDEEEDESGEYQTMSNQAMETDQNEEPSPEFIAALQKENTFKVFLENISHVQSSEEMMESEDDGYSDTNTQSKKINLMADRKNSFSEISEVGEQESGGESDSDLASDCSEVAENLSSDEEDSEKKYTNIQSCVELTPAEIEALQVEAKLLSRIYNELLKFTNELPVLGFNSARYDLNLIKTKLIKHLKKAKNKSADSFLVKRNNSYVCVALNYFKFLDVSQYLAPGFSYSAFLKAYDCSQKKGYFPYEWLDSPKKLEHTCLPSHSNFFSSLKNSNISEEEYMFCKQIWEEKGMKTFKDFLCWYNILDVEPFVEAVEKMMGFYKTYGVDLFKETLSVPGVARKIIFNSIQNKTSFALPSYKFKDIYSCFKNNIVGGPSLVFHRYHESGKTYIRGGERKCNKIIGLDANSLYLYAFSLPAPTGPMTVRRECKNFKPEKSERFMKAFHWLEWEAEQNNCFIQHKLNGGEKQIGPYRVDGFCGETNVIYSFHGCYYHGHGAAKDCPLTNFVKNEKWQKRAPELYERTVLRREFLESRGYSVIEMWECEFNQKVRVSPELDSFIQQNFTRKTDHIGEMNMQQILKMIKRDKMFGALEVDIHVPEEKTALFEEMCPLFCNSDVDYEFIGEHMQEYVSSTGMSGKSRRLLVGVLKAKKILIASPLLKWYMEHGLEVTHIYKVIEFTPNCCFSDFVNMVTEARRKGDVDPRYEMIGQTLKLIGNSAYGSMLMDPTKHTNIVYADSTKAAQKYVNDRRFMQISELEEDIFEIEMSKKRISLNLPIQIGFFILQYAKLRMLQFYYDCLDKFIDRSDFQLVCMDTDSFYLAISEPTLEGCIKQHLRSQFDAERQKWFPRNCTPELLKFDQRTPGLFKTEFEGEVIVALCSKTYCVEKREEDKTSVKFSAKGIMKKHLANPFQNFFNVLSTGENTGALNRGFRVKNNAMFTYSQYREGISYFYCKRKVHSDGVTTSPLDITGTASEQKEDA